MKTIFTSECVCSGHPDKVCDQISDAILDAILSEDKNAHVACETVASKNLLLITGEVGSNVVVDYEKIAREVIKEIGYDDPKWGFKYDEIEVKVAMSNQSSDINQGVCLSKDETGAGDQGMMFGFACKETSNYMPLSFDLASKLCKKLDEVKKTTDFLGPDGKAQISVEYNDGVISRVDTVVVSNQHSDDISLDELREFIYNNVIVKSIPEDLLDENTKIYINPTGRFVIGGPIGDAGLTGRKIIVDTYGGYAPHGGGAFSGKDPSKVDRSGAYYCRYVAKSLVVAGLCKKCEVGVSYSIGVAEPVSITVDSFGTGICSDEELVEIVKEHFDFKPASIRRELKLDSVKYEPLAAYGHMGREDIDHIPWEDVYDKAEEISKG